MIAGAIRYTLFSVGCVFFCASNANALAYRFTDLAPLPGTTGSAARSVNDYGHVVGWSDAPIDGYTAKATLWTGTATIDLASRNGTYSLAHSINNSGQVAGFSGLTDRATRWNGTTSADLGTLGGAWSEARAINASGIVAGYATTTNTATALAVTWDGTTVTTLDLLEGSFYSKGNGINSAGVVVGDSLFLDASTWHATRWDGTSVTDLGTLGGTNSFANAISDSGLVVGASSLAGNRVIHATLWSADAAIDLGTLGGDASFAYAINNTGQIVGYSAIAGGNVNHATLWNGGIVDLNDFLDDETAQSGWVLTSARGINSRGWIVGDAINTRSGITHAYLLTPVPESSIWLMVLFGLAPPLIFGRGLRKKTR